MTQSSTSHERSFKTMIRVNIEETWKAMDATYVMEQPGAPTQVTKKLLRTFPEHGYIHTVYPAGGDRHVDPYEPWLRLKPFRLNSWMAGHAVKALTDRGVAFEAEVVLDKWVREREKVDETMFVSLLARLPEDFSNWVQWAWDDPRRYVLALNSTRNALSTQDKRCALISRRGMTLAMTDNESDAMRMKLTHGGLLFDMEELRRGS